MSDKILEYIDLCRIGNTEAFAYIVAEYQQMVYTLSFRLLSDEDDAKDAVQETFIKIWKSINKYKHQYKFSTWIYKIGTNVCLDKLRAGRRILKVDVIDVDLYSEATQEEAFDNKRLKDILINLTEGLTPKQKLVFTLSELEDLEVKEITMITGLTSAKIKSNLYLARKYIKSRIGNYDK